MENKKILARYVPRFADEMKIRAWSEGTSEQYQKSLAEFERFIGERYPNVDAITGITGEMVTAYQLWLCQRENKKRGGTLSISTQRVFLNALRSFFAFCVAERIVLLDPTRNVELPKPGRRLPRGVLSPAEMRALLKAPNLATYTGLRDRAILETFYSTGIRHMELLRLRVCDVDLDRGYLTVIAGKMKKDRVVPLGKVAAHFIREYQTKARPHMLREGDTPETRLFLSINGTPLASASLYGSFRRLAKIAGLEKRLFPHGIRHTCATAMLRGRADIRYIQQMLGHESLSSTQIYTHVEIGDLKRVHARSHPREIDVPADPEWD
jgi:integrase/recombinase XerD